VPWKAQANRGWQGWFGGYGKSIEPLTQISAAVFVFTFACLGLYQIVTGRYEWAAAELLEFLVFVAIWRDRESNLPIVGILLDCTIIIAVAGLALTARRIYL
jgi:hypothetical protein